MPSKKEIAINIISALFVLMFLFAAVGKLLDYEKFSVQLSQSPVLTPIAAFVAWFIPAIEIVISLMLMIERTRLTALHASLGLMSAFTCYIILLSQFSTYTPCSCGYLLENMTHNEHLVFNIGCMGLAIIGITLHDKPERSQDNTTALA